MTAIDTTTVQGRAEAVNTHARVKAKIQLLDQNLD